MTKSVIFGFEHCSMCRMVGPTCHVSFTSSDAQLLSSGPSHVIGCRLNISLHVIIISLTLCMFEDKHRMLRKCMVGWMFSSCFKDLTSCQLRERC